MNFFTECALDVLRFDIILFIKKNEIEKRTSRMRKTVLDILALQSVDLRIRALKTKLAAIPTERAKLVKEFEAARLEFEAKKKDVLLLERESAKAAAETQALQNRHKELLIKSSSIKKAAEYHAVLAEIDSVKQKISDSETHEIELMDRLDEAKAVAEKSKRSFNAVGRLAQAEVKELDELKRKVLAEIQAKQEESARLERSVPQSSLSAYKRMLASGKGEPVGKIENGLCSNCSLRLPPQTLAEASKGGLAVCDNCSFFLYDPNSKE